jgi:hypothetical protein
MGRIFGDDGKVVDRDALRSLAFATVNLRDAGTANAAPRRVKGEGPKARPTGSY